MLSCTCRQDHMPCSAQSYPDAYGVVVPCIISQVDRLFASRLLAHGPNYEPTKKKPE
ncbi:hypothetical protein V8C37DRAFT_386668 [Trichoderma ceciliae]